MTFTFFYVTIKSHDYWNVFFFQYVIFLLYLSLTRSTISYDRFFYYSHTLDVPDSPNSFGLYQNLILNHIFTYISINITGINTETTITMAILFKSNQGDSKYLYRYAWNFVRVIWSAISCLKYVNGIQQLYEDELKYWTIHLYFM